MLSAEAPGIELTKTSRLVTVGRDTRVAAHEINSRHDLKYNEAHEELNILHDVNLQESSGRLACWW